MNSLNSKLSNKISLSKYEISNTKYFDIYFYFWFEFLEFIQTLNHIYLFSFKTTEFSNHFFNLIKFVSIVLFLKKFTKRPMNEFYFQRIK